VLSVLSPVTDDHQQRGNHRAPRRAYSIAIPKIPDESCPSPPVSNALNTATNTGNPVEQISRRICQTSSFHDRHRSRETPDTVMRVFSGISTDRANRLHSTSAGTKRFRVAVSQRPLGLPRPASLKGHARDESQTHQHVFGRLRFRFERSDHRRLQQIKYREPPRDHRTCEHDTQASCPPGPRADARLAPNAKLRDARVRCKCHHSPSVTITMQVNGG